MAIQSQWRSWLCLAAILGLIIVCACHQAARAEPQPVQIALAPHDTPPDTPALPAAQGPFGLQRPALTTAAVQAMTVKWNKLKDVVAIETRAMELCRQMVDACSSSAQRFLSIVDAARGKSGRALAGSINRAINLSIRPARDAEKFGVADVWQSPLMTFDSGSGDCEDYAIAKYAALRAAGFRAGDLKFVIVRNAAADEDHAVTAARIDGEWLILDNRMMLLLTDAQASGFTPLMAMGEDTDEAQPVRDAGLDGSSDGSGTAKG